jgi:hypothetical protein
MNNNKQVRLVDFLSCLDPADSVIINLIRGGKIVTTLFEDTVDKANEDSFLYSCFHELNCELIVTNIRYSTLESRYWIKVRRDCDE